MEPAGQMIVTGTPHSRANATTSAVPPSPPEGWPSQTARALVAELDHFLSSCPICFLARLVERKLDHLAAALPQA